VILENGLIRTMDRTLPLTRGLAIAGEWIAGGVGPHEAVLPSPDRVDLDGRCVLPGFSDSHVHFPTWAVAQRQVRLESATSLDDALAQVQKALTSVAPGGWLRGFGWRSGKWSPPVEPTRAALDTVTGETPTMLIAHDYHSIWLNSAALGRADGDLEVEGGVAEVDERGEPTGVLREQAAWRFRDRYALPPDDEFLDAMRPALKLANARGVTALHDKDGWLGALRFWQRLEAEGSLSLRVWQSLPHDRLDDLAGIDVLSGFGNPMLRLGYLKVFMDGTLGSQTARLLDGDEASGGRKLPGGRVHSRGIEITSREELAEIIRRAAARGFPVAVHAIGDRANRDALDAFAETRDEWQPRGLRQRIEHAQLLAPEDVARFGRLGVAASVQFSHAPSDRDLADRYWAGMTERAYAFRSLAEAGALLANGSDAPIEELDPLAGIRAGVLRTLDERPAWHPEQSVSVEQTLEATIVNPAWLARDEQRRGRLLPGYLADLVVLDRDPVACPPEELAAVQVVATMVGGRWVHNPPPWD
jgi:predicted amidohydrolase YtcJ